MVPRTTPLLLETHCKSSLNRISRLGTGSILALYISALCISFPWLLYSHCTLPPIHHRTSRFLCKLHGLQLYGPLSASLRCSSPLSTAIHSATRTLPVIFLSLTRVSRFHRYPFSYRCIAHSLLFSDAHFPFPPLSIRLQVRCPFSASL